jgi:hypothetical protein
MTNKVPIPVPGYVIYAQIAIDIGEKHGLETGKQTALNLAIAVAIRSGQLRTYDIDTGLPLEASEASVYVRAPDVEAWLEKAGYRYDGTELGSTESVQTQPGTGTSKRWSDSLIESLIAREIELEKAKVRGWAKQAAKEFGVDPSRARRLKKEYRERRENLRNPGSWKSPPITRDPSRG